MKNSFPNPKKHHTVFVISAVFISFLLYAYSTGITGKTLKNGTGCTCHGDNPTTSVNVVIEGPDTLLVNQSATYTVKISGGPLTRGGTNIAASAGTLIAQTGLQLMNGELTHTSPKEPVANEVTFSFSYQAPNSVSQVTLYANGNSVNFNGGNDGDSWNFAPNKLVHVVNEVPVELTSFSATHSNGVVKIEWSSATEKNNLGFEILRASSNMNWETIAFVNGNGTTTEKQNYSFTDNVSNLLSNNLNLSLKYKLKQIDYDGTINLSDAISIEIENGMNNPENFILHQNYPNPFNPSTTISYSIPEDGFVTLVLYDAIGEEAATLVNEFITKGSHSLQFFATSLQLNAKSGVYYLKMNYKNSVTQNSSSDTKKLILLK